MQKIIFLLIIWVLPIFLWAGGDLTQHFITGNPDIASINALAFGPEGILFIGDSKKAMVYAIDTQDKTEAEAPEKLRMERLDEKIAAKLGTTADQIMIQDMAVNPLSKKVYFAVHHQDGTPVLLTLSGDQLDWMPLNEVSYNKRAIRSSVEEDAKDRRGRELRMWAVSDLHYQEGKVMVSGLSNKEFSSTFRSMTFPFEEDQTDASLEIYHAAHGRYETYAPIKAFTTAMVNGKAQLIAGYTCTPLVLFPLAALDEPQHVKGRTVAELGNWNTPHDMIVMEKEGTAYLLIANSNRAVMKISFDDIEAFEGTLTERIKQRGGTEGVPFIALPWVNVTQLAKLSDTQFVMLKREATGELNLVMQTSRWL
ncbi:MAG: hypothetical protein AAFS00_11240 [Bacteroidota bacterium]